MKRKILLFCCLAVAVWAGAQEDVRTVEPDYSRVYSEIGRSRITLLAAYPIYYGSVVSGFDKAVSADRFGGVNGAGVVHFAQKIQDYLYISFGGTYGSRFVLDPDVNNQSLFTTFSITAGLGGTIRPTSWVQLGGGFELGYVQVSPGPFQDKYVYPGASGSIELGSAATMNGMDLGVVFSADWILGENFALTTLIRYDHGLFFEGNSFETGQFEHLGFPIFALGLGVFFD